jgi:hypothetical protein
MPHAETFTALGKKYEVVMELLRWYEVRCGGEIVWSRTEWPLDRTNKTLITKNKLIETQSAKYCTIEKARQAQIV